MKRYSDKFKKLFRMTEKIYRDEPGCHDWGHTLRVLHNARVIARMEGDANFAVVELGALLHDVGRPEEFDSKGALCHAKEGAKRACRMLRKCGFDDDGFVAKVAACVRNHRFRKRGKGGPESIEEKIVFDADKLDSIGAVGVGRAFHFAGQIGAKVHNTKEEAVSSKSYSRDDSAYREFLVKLRRIRGRMLTSTGREIARRRHDFMCAFFNEINREIYGSR